MRFKIYTLLLVLLCTAVSQAQTQNFQDNQYELIDGQWYLVSTEDGNKFPIIDGTITIKFENSVTESQKRAFEAQNNLTFLRKALTGWHDYNINAGVDIFASSNQLLASNLVQNLEIPTMGFYTIVPDDTLYNNLWHISQSNDADMDVDEAWDIETGDASIAVAVLDSGVDWAHPDLGVGNDTYENIFLNPGEDAWTDPNDPTTGNGVDDDGNGLIDDWKGWNFGNNYNDARRSQSGQEFFHGTHVAGIVAAKTNNNEGVSGVAGGWNDQGAQILACAVGITGPNGSVLDDAILYAAEIGARQVQLSLTVGNSSAINDAVDMAYDDFGVIIVNASGNSGNPNAVGYPGTLEKVWAIGATTNTDFRANFSQGGVDLFVSAPGVAIWSTQLTSGNPYSTSTGTSFASPNVSGVIALMLSADPTLTQDDVRQILIDTSDKVGPYNYDWDANNPGHSRELGYGRVNAFAAIQAVTLGVEDFNNGILGLSPNPASDTIQFRLQETPSGELNVRIFNLNGQEVLNIPSANKLSNNSFSLDVQGLSAGMYLLQVNSDKNNFNAKFVKN